MSKVSTISLDFAKDVFSSTWRGRSHCCFSETILADQCFAVLRAMEACAGSGREIARLGHDVRLIPPSYVKPFVKRQKNDAADAEATCDATQRATMRFFKVEASKAAAVVFLARDLPVRQ